MFPRHLHLLGATGKARTATLNNREYLVVPTVALMEGVIFPVNASSPEFVPASCLTAAAATWNNKPLMLGHPVKNGAHCSADDKDVLDAQAFGHIAEATMNGTRLGMEAWVDVARLEKLGQQKLLEDLRAGNPVEVSVGAYVKTLAKASEHKGKKYAEEWQAAFGDHLAFLPGGRGACSVAMGCGSGRHAMAHLVTAEAFEPQQESSHVIAYLRVVEESLDARMRAISQAVEKKYSTNSPVQSSTYAYPVEVFDDRVILRRNDTLYSVDYIVDAEGVVTFGEEYEVKQTYIAAAGARHSVGDRALIQDMHDRSVSLGATCYDAWTTLAAKTKTCLMCDGLGQVNKKDCEACGGDGKITIAAAYTGGSADDNTGVISPVFKAACGCEGASMSKEQRIAALLKNEHCQVKSQKVLEAYEEKDLVALEASVSATEKMASELKAASDKKAADDLKAAADKKAADDKAAADLKAAEDAKKTIEDRLTAAEAALKVASENQVTEEMRTMVADKKAADVKQKADIVASLKVASANIFTEEELNAKPIAELLKLAQIAKVELPVDYSSKALPRVPGGAQHDYTPPDSYGIKAAQEKAAQKVN